MASEDLCDNFYDDTQAIRRHCSLASGHTSPHYYSRVEGAPTSMRIRAVGYSNRSFDLKEFERFEKTTRRVISAVQSVAGATVWLVGKVAGIMANEKNEPIEFPRCESDQSALDAIPISGESPKVKRFRAELVGTIRDGVPLYKGYEPVEVDTLGYPIAFPECTGGERVTVNWIRITDRNGSVMVGLDSPIVVAERVQPIVTIHDERD